MAVLKIQIKTKKSREILLKAIAIACELSGDAELFVEGRGKKNVERVELAEKPSMEQGSALKLKVRRQNAPPGSPEWVRRLGPCEGDMFKMLSSGVIVVGRDALLEELAAHSNRWEGKSAASATKFYSELKRKLDGTNWALYHGKDGNRSVYGLKKAVLSRKFGKSGAP